MRHEILNVDIIGNLAYRVIFPNNNLPPGPIGVARPGVFNDHVDAACGPVKWTHKSILQPISGSMLPIYSENTPLRSQAPGREGQKELGELYMAT